MNKDFSYLQNSIIGFFLLSSTAYSGTMGSVQEKSCTWVGTISAGPTWESAGRSQTLFLQPDVQKTYSARKKSDALATGELFLGLQHSFQNWQGQIGIAAAVAGNAKLQGDIWEDADPDFNNFTYQYKVQHSRILVKGKVIARNNWIVQPYINAGLGVGFNKAKDYSSTPKIPEEVPAPSFTSNSKTAFTYTVGIGIQKAFGEHWQGGIGYEFADWGKSALGPANGQTLNTGLALSHLYTNSLLFSLSYIA